MHFFDSRDGGSQSRSPSKSLWRCIDETARVVNPFLLIAAIALAMLDLLYYAQWVVATTRLVIENAVPGP